MSWKKRKTNNLNSENKLLSVKSQKNKHHLSVNDKSKAYKLYNPITNKIVINSDVIFDEELTLSQSNTFTTQQISTNFDGENEDGR